MSLIEHEIYVSHTEYFLILFWYQIISSINHSERFNLKQKLINKSELTSDNIRGKTPSSNRNYWIVTYDLLFKSRLPRHTRWLRTSNDLQLKLQRERKGDYSRFNILPIWKKGKWVINSRSSIKLKSNLTGIL